MDDPEYAYETSVTVRFRDLDQTGLVHNSVLLIYVEEARVRYFRDVIGTDITETNGAVARQEIDYEHTVALDSALTVRYRTTRIGDSSITMEFEVIADDTLAARGEVVHIVLDDTGEVQSVPDEWRKNIRSFEPRSVEMA